MFLGRLWGVASSSTTQNPFLSNQCCFELKHVCSSRKFHYRKNSPKPQTFELLAKFQVPVEVRFGKGPKLGIFGFEPFTKMLHLNNIQGSYTIENTQVLKIIGQRPLETEISNFELNFFRNLVTSQQLYARYFLLNFKLQSWTPNTTISYEKTLPKFFSESRQFLDQKFQYNERYCCLNIRQCAENWKKRYSE